VTLRVWSLGLGLGLVGAACSGFNVGDDTGCAAACERAGACGFLPSALGWSDDPNLALSVEDCTRRCGNSPRSDPTVSKLVACLDGEQQSTDWCDDDTADDFLRWQECAGIAKCLDAIAERNVLAGTSSLTVNLVSFQDFETDFSVDGDTGGNRELLTVADLYSSPPVMGESVQSCRAALCSSDACAESEVDRPCDDTLCRNPTPTATEVCETLGIEKLGRIILTARQPDKMQARLTMFDATDETTTCSKSTTVELKADYALVPGPMDIAVQISGTLPASELVMIDYPGADEALAVKPDATMEYCLEFYGPSVILRAGNNPALIPVGDIGELVERGLDTTKLGVCPD
jgi:hypothetical protein